MARTVKLQMIAFVIITLIALIGLGWYYLRIPSLLGVGQYTLHVELPRSGGLYETSNVTYRGIEIGKVTAVEPTEQGALATMRIDSRYRIPIDAAANVRSVSAVGEQYVNLVSTGNPGEYLQPGQTIAQSTVPTEIAPVLDATYRALEVVPAEKIDTLLNETAQGVAGLGPPLQRLVDSTTNMVSDFKANLAPVNDIITNVTPILGSQVQSRDAIEQWSRNLNTMTTQASQQDAALRSMLQQAAPTTAQINTMFSDVGDSLPQTLANMAIITDLLKRYNKGLEQVLVLLPQSASIAQSATIFDDTSLFHFGANFGMPPICLTGFLPASEWRSPADTSPRDIPAGQYCKIPKDFQGNAVRGARNNPCMDVPGKRAATPQECRSDEPYTPMGTNPWYGDPNQIRSCPAPGARCDQPVLPGRVIPAPSVNNGLNPLPADQLPQTSSPAPTSDPLTAPGQGTVRCNGQQPNPCGFTPEAGASAIYSPSSGEVVGPDGVKYSVSNSSELGDNGWKEMLVPAG